MNLLAVATFLFRLFFVLNLSSKACSFVSRELGANAAKATQLIAGNS